MARDPGRVLIFDTTLRDGEQSPGASLNLEEKLAIAQQLARLGVDIIEAGFPFASSGDFNAVQRIAATVGTPEGPVICGLARAAHVDPAIPLDARMGGALLGTLFLLPPIAYAVAALSHLVARAFGGTGSFFSARLALFWALLAVSPLMLLQGLVRGFIGPGPALTLVGLAVLATFLMLWVTSLIESERR